MKNEIPAGLAIIMCLLAAFVGALLSGITCDRDYKRLQEEAVKTGHAEYVIVDQLKGTTEWRWKKIETEKK